MPKPNYPNPNPNPNGGPPPPSHPPQYGGARSGPRNDNNYGDPPEQQHYGGYPRPPSSSSLVPSDFPPGTDPKLISCFQVADQDGSGFIGDKELQCMLSTGNHTFALRTIHLLMYSFTNSHTRMIGRKEFIQVYYSLQNWRLCFERFDRDRSGMIDATELRAALQSLVGFSISPMIVDFLVSKFDKSGGSNKGIEYDSFIQCCLTVKGLSEKFKEKDTAFSTYESFMLAILPFL